MKMLLILVVVAMLSGCASFYDNGSFPPCNSDAPRHYKAVMGWNADNSDAGVVGQSATLQGWINVSVHHPAFQHDYVLGDCVK